MKMKKLYPDHYDFFPGLGSFQWRVASSETVLLTEAAVLFTARKPISSSLPTKLRGEGFTYQEVTSKLSRIVSKAEVIG